MSYHGKYSGGGDSRRHSSSSSRRDSPPRHRSRRTPSPGPSRGRSPKPRDPKNLPESFGRQPEQAGPDDELNILQRMKTAYECSPLANLYDCIKENRKIKIWTRNYKEVRGILTGYLVAFDKHWNLILRDVDEVYLRPKKSKTPFLRDIEPNESLPDMPVKVPKERKNPPQQPPQPEPNSASADPEKKKKKRKKRSKNISEKRQVDKIFVRGDNIVMISTYEEEVEEQAEEEEEENPQSG